MAVLVAAPSVAVFAPVEQRHYHLTLVETRSDGAATMRFTATRDLVFTREPGGWRVAVRLLGLTHDAPAAVGRVQDAALAPLVGRTMIVHLDAAGAVVAIDELDAIWSAIVDGLGDAGGGAAESSLRSLAAPMAALPAPQRLRMLGAEVADVACAAAVAAMGQPARPVTLTSGALPGVPVTLTGTRGVTAAGADVLVETTRAAGGLPAGHSPVAIAVTIERRIDRARGLLIESRKRVETTIGDARSVTESSASLAMVS